MMCAVCMFDGRRQEELIDLKDGQIDALRAAIRELAAEQSEDAEAIAASAKAQIQLRAERDALRHDLDRSMARESERLQEVEQLRALLLKSYCYVAAHVPIGVKTDNDRKVIMLDIDAALRSDK